MTNIQNMVRLNLDLSPELNQILDELANKIGTSKSDVLRQAITLMQIMDSSLLLISTKVLGKKEASEITASQVNRGGLILAHCVVVQP